MKLTVLGYWGGYPWQGEGTSSYLLQAEGYNLLIDAGSSTLNVLQTKINPFEIDSVLISHYHHDHIADLGVLQYYRQLASKTGEVPILPIYGHQEDQQQFPQLTLTGISQGYPYQETDQLDLGPFTVTFLRTVHPVTCFAMRIVEKRTQKVLVYTADTGYFPELNEFVRGADVLLSDTYFLTGHENHHAHLTSKETGELAKKNHVKQVLLSHLSQTCDLAILKAETSDFAGPEVTIQLAYENLTLTI